MTDKQPQGFPQAPGAPAWNEKPKAGGAFAVLIVAVGIASALFPSEGRKLQVYKDSAGIDTVCMGLIGSITKRHPGVDFTVEECKTAEAEYIAPMVKQMQQCVPVEVRNSMTYGEWVTYGHWSYNTGTSSFCSSSLGSKLRAGDHDGACKAMSGWTFITYKGKKRNCRDADMQRICSGIVKRRDQEVSNCLNAL